MSSPSQNKNIYQDDAKTKSILTSVPKDIMKIIKTFNIETRRPLRLTVSRYNDSTGIEIEKYKDGYKIRMVTISDNEILFRYYPYEDSMLMRDSTKNNILPILSIDSVDDLIEFIHITLIQTYFHTNDLIHFSFEQSLSHTTNIDSNNFNIQTKRMISLLGKLYATIQA